MGVTVGNKETEKEGRYEGIGGLLNETIAYITPFPQTKESPLYLTCIHILLQLSPLSSQFTSVKPAIDRSMSRRQDGLITTVLSNYKDVT